jgi:hypothetical protein
VTLVAVLVAVFALHAPHALGDQYDRFIHGTRLRNYSADLRQRLTDPGNNGRVDVWRIAWHGFSDAQLHGHGADTYALLWARQRPIAFKVLNAHSLYLEVLDELGVVGLALLGLALLLVLGGALRRARGPGRTTYAAIVAITSAWAIHAGIDWDWQMPVVTLPVIALAGASLARPMAKGAETRLHARLQGPGSLPRVAVGAAVMALAIIPGLLRLSEGDVQTSLRAFGRGACAQATSAAQRSLTTVGTRPEPWEVIAYCRANRGQFTAATNAMMRAAAGQDPRSDLRAALQRNPLEALTQAALRQFSHVTKRERRSQAAHFPTSILGVRYAPVTPPSGASVLP